MWLIVLLAALVCAAILLLISSGRQNSTKAERIAEARANWLTGRLMQALHEHESTLIAALAQKRIADAYGGWVTTGWRKELAQFFDSAVAPRLPADISALEVDELRATLDFWAGEIDFDDWPELTGHLNAHRDGIAYEREVAASLAKLGFSVSYTPMTGDQGVDLIAQRQGERLVVQCKNYAAPVGNDAVQQIYAGAAYHDASRAAVVAPHGFTLSAKELAASLGVICLHHSELDRFVTGPGSSIADPAA